MNRTRWLWLFPLALGGLAGLYFGTWRQDTPILYLRMDAGTFALLCGLVLAGLLLAVHLGLRWKDRYRQQIEASLRNQARQERRRFLQRLDHELKNPLTAIRAVSANIGVANNRDKLDEMLASLNSQVDRIVRLTGDLRKVADIPEVALDLQSVDMPELLQEVVEAVEIHQPASDRQLTVVAPQAPWPPPPVRADRDLLYLAIFNLVDNSMKFSKSGDAVELRLMENGDWITVEVADTGCGINQEEQPEVWHELYRGSQSRKVEGSGLGLSLVKAIVERHQGRISLRSRPGQGTVVTMELPAAGSS